MEGEQDEDSSLSLSLVQARSPKPCLVCQDLTIKSPGVVGDVAKSIKDISQSAKSGCNGCIILKTICVPYGTNNIQIGRFPWTGKSTREGPQVLLNQDTYLDIFTPNGKDKIQILVTSVDCLRQALPVAAHKQKQPRVIEHRLRRSFSESITMVTRVCHFTFNMWTQCTCPAAPY